MSGAWTQDRVLQLAPDPASAKAGQGLANARKWVTLGRDDRVVWGECQGSGAKPYQTQFDLLEVASKCSCPSRKFPCKHALGLMLIFSSDAAAVTPQAAPAWVTEWLSARDERAQKKQAKAEAPPKPVDAAAQAQRREKRLTRIGDGLAALKTWCEDLLRGGIATVPSKGYAFFDEPARRMIDAQAPGAGRRIAMLGEAAASGAGWQRPFLEQLASIHLLIRAFERIDSLGDETRHDVFATLGLPAAAEDAAASRAPVHDTWQAIAQEVELEDRLRVQRTWLFGCTTKRAALVLAFAHGTAPLDMTLAPATTFEGDVVFHPGNGIRAEIASRAQANPSATFHGFQTLDELCDWSSLQFSQQPWLGEVAAPLRSVTPARDQTGWAVIDSERKSLPAAMPDDAGWLALAMSGGHPVDLVTAYDGRRLRPLAIVSQGEYVSLRTASVLKEAS